MDSRPKFQDKLRRKYSIAMPSETSTGRAIANGLLQIILLPVNFVIWLVTSPELITLLCILSEILIELVVSAVMAGVSIIVSAVILMEDDPEPTLILTPPQEKKSFLYGGDLKCIAELDREAKEEKERREREKAEKAEKANKEKSDEDRKSVDKEPDEVSPTSSSRSLGFLDRWLPKYGTPRGEPQPPVPTPESVAEAILAEGQPTEAELAELEKAAEQVADEIVADAQMAAAAAEEIIQEGGSEKAASEKVASDVRLEPRISGV